MHISQYIIVPAQLGLYSSPFYAGALYSLTTIFLLLYICYKGFYYEGFFSLFSYIPHYDNRSFPTCLLKYRLFISATQSLYYRLILNTRSPENHNSAEADIPIIIHATVSFLNPVSRYIYYSSLLYTQKPLHSINLFSISLPIVYVALFSFFYGICCRFYSNWFFLSLVFFLLVHCIIWISFVCQFENKINANSTPFFSSRSIYLSIYLHIYIYIYIYIYISICLSIHLF